MTKFRIYRAIAIVFFLLTLLASFLPAESAEIWNEIRVTSTMLLVILFFVCYALLMSIFNYYKEAGWKNVAVIFFLSGNIVFYFLSMYGSVSNPFHNFFILLFYLPFIVAFATVSAKEIKPLTQSFGYLMLIICSLHIALPFLRNAVNLSDYTYFFNVIFLLPSVIIILLFSRMITISGRKTEAEVPGDDEQHDLL